MLLATRPKGLYVARGVSLGGRASCSNFGGCGQRAIHSVQRTVARPVELSGVGIHSGLKSSIRIEPAGIHSGIKFIRQGQVIPAAWDHVSDTQLCTKLSASHQTVHTVEHLMAAMAACGLSNALIHCSSSEMPVMDGSSMPFIKAIEEAGIEDQDAAINVIEVRRPVQVILQDKSAAFLPLPSLGPYSAHSLVITVQVDFQRHIPGNFWFTTHVPSSSFIQSTAPARTFAFKEEVDAIFAAGLGKGGSLENTVIFDTDTVLNDGGLRFKDEWVRHKALDCAGDLFLAGAASCSVLHGHFVGIRPGHQINNLLLRELLSHEENFSLRTLPT